ncbi:MAG: Hpt domain-containing protein [Opitutales bacterium]
MDIDEIRKLPITDDEQLSMLIEAGEDGAADLIEELLDLFRTEAGPQVEAMRTAITHGAGEEAARPAHAISGSSANLGGLRLSKLAKAMELAAGDGRTAELTMLSAEMQDLYNETIKAFEAEIAKLREA